MEQGGRGPVFNKETAVKVQFWCFMFQTCYPSFHSLVIYGQLKGFSYLRKYLFSFVLKLFAKWLFTSRRECQRLGEYRHKRQWLLGCFYEMPVAVTTHQQLTPWEWIGTAWTPRCWHAEMLERPGDLKRWTNFDLLRGSAPLNVNSFPQLFQYLISL